MSKQWRWVPAALAALSLALATAPAGTAVAPESSGAEVGINEPRNLLSLSVDTADPGRLAVSLGADGALAFDSFVLADPDRLVLDLPGVTSRLEDHRVDVDSAGLSRIRAAQHETGQEPVTRVVFDLERPLAYSIESVATGLVVHFAQEAPTSVAFDAPVDAPEFPEPAAQPEIAGIVQEMEARAEGLGLPVEPRLAVSSPGVGPVATRVADAGLIERLQHKPSLAAQAEGESTPAPSSFQTRTIGSDAVEYSGRRISLNLVDADIKQVFRLFHEISALNFVLDPGVSGRVTVVLDHVPWDQALDIILKNNSLDKVLENNVIRIATTQKLAQEAAARKQLREAKELEVEPITITRTLSYGKALDVERVIRDSGVLTPRGRVIVDERTNTLIISDIPKKVEPLDTLISTLDAETPQVMIEARIVETSRDFVQDLGVIWSASAIADASKGTSTGLSFPHNASARYGLNLPGEGGASSLAFKLGNVIDSFTLDVTLNTLETEGMARVLSSPRIATQNNELAEIEQGVRIPIVNTTATEIDVEFVSASLKMTVTPQITADGTIILDVLVENNSPDFVNTAGGIPSIRTQRAQTKVLISDGGTTVIGGIFTINEGQSEVGVPWFRKIPVFGWLFKTSNITKQNRELLIFITPKIMRVA